MKITAVPWKKASTDDNAIPLEGASPDDIVIPVVGPTGVGKSTFINFLAGEEVAKVDHGLSSFTYKLQPVIIHPSQRPLLGGKRLVIVDTPGFTSSYGPDPDVFGSIASWLKSAYGNDMKLYGIIHLHDISLSSMRGGHHHDFKVFQKFCDDVALRNVVLGTTKWGDVYEEDGEMRITQLCEHYWKEMLEHGSKVHRFEDSSESAWSMVGSIIEANRNRAVVLQIQQKLVEAQKLLPDTEEGQKLRGGLEQVFKNFMEGLKTNKRDESQRRGSFGADREGDETAFMDHHPESLLPSEINQFIHYISQAVASESTLTLASTLTRGTQSSDETQVVCM